MLLMQPGQGNVVNSGNLGVLNKETRFLPKELK